VSALGEPAAHREPVHIGQHHVQDHHVRPVGFDSAQRFVARLHGRHPVTGEVERGGQQFGDPRLVVDHEQVLTVPRMLHSASL
jgi:hypothetical protein